LIEFAANQISPRSQKGIVQFFDKRGFSNARIAGNENQSAVVIMNAVKSIEQRLDFCFPSIEFLRDQQLGGAIALP